MEVLLLNATYEPLRPTSLKRALRLVLDGKADVLEAGDAPVCSGESQWPRPLVIRLKKFIKVPARFRKHVTNTFLFARDSYTCQYCGRHESQLRKSEAINRDHVLPRSRGGDNSWTNCVTACTTCNSRKDNRTPAEAGMTLLREPIEPHLVYLKWSLRKLTPLQAQYVTMFFGEDWKEGAKDLFDK